jgi:WD40 repeat protein
MIRPSGLRLLVLVGTLSLLLAAERPLGATEPRARATLKHKDQVNSVAFSPDGTLLATCGADKTITLWDMETNRVKPTFKGHANGSDPVSFSGDGTLLASSDGKMIKVWNVRTGKAQTTIHAARQFGVRLSPDGKTLASVSVPEGGLLDLDETRIKVWDVATGKERASFKGCRQVCFSPDGSTLAVGDPRGVLLWDVQEGKRKAHIGPGNLLDDFCFSPDGKTLASTSAALGGDGSAQETIIRQWDVETRKEKAAFTLRGSARVWTFTPDGKTLAVTQRGYPPEVVLYAAATGKKQAHFKPDACVGSFSFSPDGKTLAVSGWSVGGESVPLVWLFDVPVGGAAAPHRGRSIFTYKENAVPGTFKHLKDNVWVEHSPKGERFRFEEVTRNNRYIEIYDKKRDVGVRIYANKTLWMHPEDTKGKWEMLYEGEWSE